jgi:DNA-directed RNA polymerase subunit F
MSIIDESNEKNYLFFIEIKKIGNLGKIGSFCRERILIGLAKMLHTAHGYKWKEVPEENKKEGHYKITITGSQSDCLNYLRKFENMDEKEIKELIDRDANKIKKLMGLKWRENIRKKIDKTKSKAIDNIKNQLLFVGIYLDYGVE